MSATALPAALQARLAGLLPAGALLVDGASRLAYGVDNSAFRGLPLAVALPDSHHQVEAVVAACAEAALPIVARGRGSNTTGASVPVAARWCSRFERMQRIIAIDHGQPRRGGRGRRAQRRPAAGAGAARILLGARPDVGAVVDRRRQSRLQRRRSARGEVRRLPRQRAGAARGRRPAAWLPQRRGSDQERQRLRSRPPAGRLEGTLALITEATLRLTPLPEARRGLRALYRDIAAAAAAVARVMAQPVAPCALEFIDGAALALVRARGVDLPPRRGAALLLEVDGRRGPRGRCRRRRAAASGDGLLALDIAPDAAAQAALWAARKALSPALRSWRRTRSTRTWWCRWRSCRRWSPSPSAVAAPRLPVVCFGHAGNGNLHVNLMLDRRDPRQAAAAEAAGRAVRRSHCAGRHAVGRARHRPGQARLHGRRTRCGDARTDARRSRRAFDPHGILNPGQTAAVTERLDG
jgi:D-lactate dehydrogenase (quinone)